MRQELPEMVALAERMLHAGVDGTLATLFSARGSTYRPLGSMMVGFPGMRAGGVSGGCLEDYVARQGAIAPRDRPIAVLRFTADPDADDHAPVLGCGGAIELLVERLTADHVALLRQLVVAYDADEPSILVCTLERSCAGVSVSRHWLRAAPGAGRPSGPLGSIGAEVRRDKKTRHVALGADRAALVHYVPPLTRVVIFGAGDDARPLCDLGHSLGWHVTVADRRARLATRARFPHADAVVAGPWDEVVGSMRFTPRTVAVLMAHSLPDDTRVLTLLADEDLAYVGLLGPAHRREWLLEEAAAEGTYLSDEFTARLHGPVGLDLGDRSAAGIAVSVVAEVLAVLNERGARALSARLHVPTTRTGRALGNG